MNALRSMKRLLLLVALALFGASCADPMEEPELPEPRYHIPFESGLPPEGAALVSHEEFAELWASGELILAGPEADRETEEREALKDEEDRATIRDYEAEFLGTSTSAQPVLRELGEPGPTSRVVGSGQVEHTISRAGRPTITVLNQGERFRLRSAAESIRRFHTKENQLGTFQHLYASLSPEWQAKLQLPALTEASQLEMSELLRLNALVASKAPEISAEALQAEVEPIYPPLCGTEEGRGDALDTSGNDDSCLFSLQGLMLNYHFPNKRYVSCVKSQARRGSCVAFSSASAMESEVHRTHGRSVNLSEQALYARMKLVWGGGQHYGDGFHSGAGFFSSFMEGFLVPFEEQWNYNPSWAREEILAFPEYGAVVGYSGSCFEYSEECSNSTHQTDYFCTELGGQLGPCGYIYPADVNPDDLGFSVAAPANALWDPANRDLSLQLMILALHGGAQIVWGFDVQTSSSSTDDHGFVTFVSSYENENNGGHATHMIGYVSNTKLAEVLPYAPPGAGGGYFIVKNSWGNCYGDGGYFYVPYSSVRAYTTSANQAPPVR